MHMEQKKHLQNIMPARLSSLEILSVKGIVLSLSGLMYFQKNMLYFLLEWIAVRCASSYDAHRPSIGEPNFISLVAK